MSWLRNHVQQFVIPGIRTMVRRGDHALTAADIKPFDGSVRPATVCKYEEAGLLYATIASMVPKKSPNREALLAMCRTVDGTALTGTRTTELGARFSEVPPGDVVHAIIWNSLRKLRKMIRRNGAVLVLPGRDVWPWEVIARQRRLSSIYDSRVSRTVSSHRPALIKVIDQWKLPDLNKSLVFDTGFNGSIHRDICVATNKKPESLMLSAYDHNQQIFKGHTASRAKALAIEYFPKYFQRATVHGDEAYQALALLEEFIKTALLTIWLWYHVSPAHIESAKEAGLKVKQPNKYVVSGKSALPAGVVNFSNFGVTTSTNPIYFTGGIPFSPAIGGGGFIGGTVVTNPWYTTAATTIPNINIVSNGAGALSYQIPIAGPESTQLLHNVLESGAGPGGLLHQQTAEHLLEQSQELKQLWGDNIQSELINAKLDDIAMKKQLAADLKNPAVQAFAAKVPQSMVADYVDTTPLQKLHGMGPMVKNPALTASPLSANQDVFIPHGKKFVDPETFELKQPGYVMKAVGLPLVIGSDGKPLAG